jgi:hypothetical protein
LFFSPQGRSTVYPELRRAAPHLGKGPIVTSFRAQRGISLLFSRLKTKY